MGGCGTHFFVGLFNAVGFKRVFEPILMIQAIMLARKNPAAPCRLFTHIQYTASEAVKVMAKDLSVTPPSNFSSDEQCFECIGTALKNLESERMVIGWQYYFSVSSPMTTPDGEEVVWSLEDRDDAQILLEQAMAYLNIDFRQVAVVRNPIDIYFSLTERYLTDNLKELELFKDRAKNEIGDYFSSISVKSKEVPIPVLTYEEVCRASDSELFPLLSKFHFTTDDIEGLDKSLVHKGALEKWRLYSPSEVKKLAFAFKPYMAPFNYNVNPRSQLTHFLASKIYALRKYYSEFKVINRLTSGDFSVNWAFSHHTRSIPARIWFRLLILFPIRRKNVALYYKTFKDTDHIPTRPYSVIFHEIFGGPMK